MSRATSRRVPRTSAKAKRPAKKFRESGARTHTVGAGEVTDSSSSIGGNALPKGLRDTLKICPSNFINDTGGGQIVVADGEQRCATLLTFLNKTELDTLSTAVGNAGSAGKLAYLGGRGDLMITNHGSGTLRFYLYVVITRRDSDGSAPTKFLEGIDDTGGTATSYTDFGARPHMSYEYKIFKKTHAIVAFNLAPGQTHVHHFTSNAKRIYDSGTAAQVVGGIVYLKGWTTELMVISHGVAACDSVGANVTLSDGQFNYIWTKRHHVKSVQDKVALMTFTSTLPAKNTITTRLYNTDTSAPENVNTGD